MIKVRILGPGERLGSVLRAVQDVGVLHLTAPGPVSAKATPKAPPVPLRRLGQLERAAADAETAIALLGLHGTGREAGAGSLPSLVREVRRIRRTAELLVERRHALEEERALLQRYRHLFEALESLLPARAMAPEARAYQIVLRRDQASTLPALRHAIRELVGDGFELPTRTLPSGETAMLLLVPKVGSEKVERLLRESRVQEIPVPGGYGTTLEEALPRIRDRNAALPGALERVGSELLDLGTRNRDVLFSARALFHDELARLAALPLSSTTAHTFVLEGWTPEAAEPRLGAALERGFGGQVVIERVRREEWRADEAPVVLANPRLFRPFELITRTLPIPRYGSLDPTPFVAVFFPMFFGLMLGDAGYGAAAALLALVIHRRSRPDTVWRSVAEVLGACALFAILFGLGFGELFGDLGRRWFGLRPVLLDREAALVPFLGLAIALGIVHVVVGLAAGAISGRRTEPRKAAGKGLSAIMITLIVTALLGAVRILPRGFITPAVITVLVAFPVLIVLEGIVAPVELMSHLGHILSYTRIMALGTASVMLALIANRLAGAAGGVVVGILFGLLFHLVNFALGLFSPAIHALRLHYVEFFGTFYSPGGVRYEPLAHWAPTVGQARMT